MDKTAAASHHISEIIAKRWSPRAFPSKPIEQDKIMSLFEAARWAPS
ncbi:MAG: nitroreductase family protein, partial [Synergistaceae bacterium]